MTIETTLCTSLVEKISPPLSKYIEVVEYGDSFVLFNKLNGCIVQLEKSNFHFEANKTYLIDISKSDFDFLDSNDFFVEDKIVQQYIQNHFLKPTLAEETNLTLSVTERCNLSCAYCYQHGWNRNDSLTDIDYVDVVRKYLQSIIPDIEQEKGLLKIYFIGGEPMLNSELILELLDMIEKTNNSRVEIKYHIDSNITMITKDFIKQFPNLQVCTTLTPAEDHNMLRSNSYTSVLGKMNEIKDLFDGEKYRMVIRYNVNHENIGGIERTLNELSSLNFCWSIDVKNIMNSPQSLFHNDISEEDFERIYLEKIVPILIAHNLRPTILPICGLSRKCRAASIFDRKIYSNGQFTLCDAFPKGGIGDQIPALPLLPQQCVTCADFPYCGGPKPCDTFVCNGTYSHKEDAIARIRTYMKYYTDPLT